MRFCRAGFTPATTHAMKSALYAVAVIIPTTLRPELCRAVRSVFAQDFPGSVQILIGIDVVGVIVRSSAVSNANARSACR